MGDDNVAVVGRPTPVQYWPESVVLDGHHDAAAGAIPTSAPAIPATRPAHAPVALTAYSGSNVRSVRPSTVAASISPSSTANPSSGASGWTLAP